MVEVGGHPLLWHILKHYGHYGYRDFYIALGYKGDVVKRYFQDYYSLSGNLSVSLKSGDVRHHERETDDWLVHLIDTGADVMTGGRVRRLRRYLSGESFLLTYGDGVSNVDVRALVAFHRAHGKVATVTAVRPPARFGGIVFDGDLVGEFTEKPQIGEGWINGGFMVFEPQIFDYLASDSTVLEADTFERLVAERQLAAYRHEGFWQCVDTLRDLRTLERLWQSPSPPWRHDKA